jgi:hypothetical protein
MKLALIIAAAFVALFLARHWDYEDTQRTLSAQNWARVANR